MTPEEIIDRWHSPLFAGKPGNGNWKSGVGHNRVCGDVCTIHILFTPDGIIEKCLHETDACTLTTAAADLLCEHMTGRNINNSIDFNLETILGIPIGINRRQCIQAPVDAFHKAFK